MANYVSTATPADPGLAPMAGRMYRPELDTLRLLAFLGVFVFHALPHDPSELAARGLHGAAGKLTGAVIQAGAFGVDLFFCLSAFLITRLLLREWMLKGSVDFWAFYVRRSLRIWPLYIAAVVLYLALLPLLGIGEFQSRRFVSYLLFGANWFVALGNEPGHASHLWSISFEEQFYILWPLVMIAVGLSRIGLVVVCMFAIAGGSRAVAIHLDADAHMRWMNTFLRLDPLAVGVLLAIVLPSDFSLAPLGRVLLGSAGALVPVACLLVFGLNTGWDMLTYPLVAIGCGMVLVAVLQRDASGIMTNPCVVHLGKVSYGLYVYHPLCLWIAGSLVSVGGIPLALLLTVAMAQTSYVVLEAPFLRLKQRFEFVSSRPV